MRESLLRLETLVSAVYHEPNVKAHDYEKKGD